MLTPNLTILYVAEPLVSAAFYEARLGQAPSQRLSTWVAWDFPNGTALGLWSLRARDFRSGGAGHRSELAFLVEDNAEVRDLYARWQAEGVLVEQPLQEAVFGLTFVALDPDGHRLRVCVPDK